MTGATFPFFFYPNIFRIMLPRLRSCKALKTGEIARAQVELDFGIALGPPGLGVKLLHQIINKGK